MIHPSAIVHPGSEIAEGVEIGPYSIVGPDVTVGRGTRIGSHVVLNGPTRIGKDNHIYQFCSIGDNPQDRKYAGEQDSVLEIGNGNVIREFCTINRGTGGGGGVTRVGNDNWIMAYVHIAHDCIVGNNNVFANNATLAGHVTVADHVTLGGFTGVHQFCRIGRHAFSAIASVIVKDVPPYLTVSGNTASPGGLNREGLKRHGMDAEQIRLIRKAYKILYRENRLLTNAVEELAKLAKESPEVTLFLEFILGSKRGIVR